MTITVCRPRSLADGVSVGIPLIQQGDPPIKGPILPYRPYHSPRGDHTRLKIKAIGAAKTEELERHIQKLRLGNVRHQIQVALSSGLSRLMVGGHHLADAQRAR